MNNKEGRYTNLNFFLNPNRPILWRRGIYYQGVENMLYWSIENLEIM
jgi:hypothetical protein